MRRRGKQAQGTTTETTVQEDESLNEKTKGMSIVSEEDELDEMAAKVERVAASAHQASFYQVETSVYAFGDQEPLLTPTNSAAMMMSQELRTSRRTPRFHREFPATSSERRASIRPLQDFRLRYHARLVVQQSWRMLKMLVHGTPRWITKLARMICFVTSMMPAFVVFGLFYMVTSDRIAVPYKEKNRTSRHYLDIYGSSTNNDGNNNSDASRQQLKPVVFFLTGGAWIIGYKMWGALLARALVPFGIMVVIPDYRNFPQTNVNGIIEDADLAVDWTLKNIHEYGGDPSRLVIVGQSAGAHIGACLMLRKSQLGAPTENQHVESNSSWHAVDVCGFIAVSGPYDLEAMREILHQHGLDRSIVSAMFCNDPVKYSPTVMVRDLDNGHGMTRKRVQANFPPTCIIHGEIDKTVPYKQSLEFFEALLRLGVEQPLEFKLYPSWSHTDPILEAPFAGNHLFHKDVYELVKRWTCDDIIVINNGTSTDEDEKVSALCDGDCQLLPFDENHPACQKICPTFLVEIGRFCNPF